MAKIASVDTRELEEAVKYLKVAVGPKNSNEIMKEAAAILEGHVKTKLDSNSRSGKTYIIQGNIHQASAPGEPPAVETGKLIGSIFSQLVRDYLSEVATDTEYAPHLEFGTSKMGARPFLTPAFEENIQEIVKYIEARIAEEIQGAIT